MKSARSHKLVFVTSTYVVTKLVKYVRANAENRHAQDEFTNADSSKREHLVQFLSE